MKVSLNFSLVVGMKGGNGIANNGNDQVHDNESRDNDKGNEREPCPFVDGNDLSSNISPIVQCHNLKESKEGSIYPTEVIIIRIFFLVQILEELGEHDCENVKDQKQHQPNGCHSGHDAKEG